MERRRFLQMLGLGAGAVALEQAIPFGRVWSFPKKIVIASAPKWIMITTPGPFGRSRFEDLLREDMSRKLAEQCDCGIVGLCAGFEWDKATNLTTTTFNLASPLES